MKKTLAILLALSVLALSACAAKQAASDTQEQPGAEIMEQGGVDLTSDDSGVYYAVGLDDAKSYHELGKITVPVAEGFVLTDNSDLEHSDETYAASDLTKLAASELGFTANNTLATIEHGELTVLARSYTP